MDFLKELKRKFLLFMRGRYGHDELNLVLLGLYLLFMLLRFISPIRWLDNLFLSLGFFVILIAIIRSFSKNIYARSKENELYLKYKHKYFYQPKPTHKIYHCPSCNQKVRVPKGRGKIEITCPKCKNRFTKRT